MFLGKSKVILSFFNLGRGVQMWCGLKPTMGIIPKESIGLDGSCLQMKALPQYKKEKSMTMKDRGTPVTFFFWEKEIFRHQLWTRLILHTV
jgi:hypothetical protein